MGRPLKEIDGEQVRKFAAVGSTQEEIAAYFNCAQSTISERFRLEFQLGNSQSKKRLRSRQFKRAMEGSDTMLIHLGKNMLGQSDKHEIKQEAAITLAGPTPDLSAAIEAFGYIRPTREDVGPREPSALCNPGEPGGMADQGCASSEAVE